MNSRMTRRLCGVAVMALLAAACSSDDPRPSPEPTPSTATTVIETVPTTEDAAASSTTDARPSDEPAADVPAATSATADLEPPTVTITDGPTGTTTGRDKHGEGGVFRVTWDVSPVEAACSFSLNDANGNSAVHQVVSFTGDKETERNLEVLYTVTPDGLPITITISCRTDDGAATVIGETVRIVEPGEEPDDGTAITEPKLEIVRWDRAELKAVYADYCSPPYAGDADTWAKWFAHYGEYAEAHLTGRSIAPKWPQPTTMVLPALYERISQDGYRVGDDASEWVTEEGIVPLRDISHMETADIAAVLHDWMSYRYQFAPEGDHAPAAWALRIVSEMYSLTCVANIAQAGCPYRDVAHEYVQNRHLRYDAGSSSLGRALWSIVCGQAPTEERLGDDS